MSILFANYEGCSTWVLYYSAMKVDTDINGYFYSIRLQWYIHEHLVQQSFKIIFISIETVVDNCCEDVGQRVGNFKKLELL